MSSLRIFDLMAYHMVSADDNMNLTLTGLGVELYTVLKKMMELPDPEFPEI